MTTLIIKSTINRSFQMKKHQKVIFGILHFSPDSTYVCIMMYNNRSSNYGSVHCSLFIAVSMSELKNSSITGLINNTSNFAQLLAYFARTERWCRQSK